MPGDALIANPTITGTGAVTVHAPPEDIWPWLVQMGHQRGGLYCYDWLDRLFGFLDRPSATRILPEFQQLAVGDKIYFGREELTVTVLEPLRALVLSYQARGMEWVWQFGLYPLDEQRTRLVERGTEWTPSTVAWWLGMRIMEPAGFIMTRRFLLGVKERAEALRASHFGGSPPDRSTSTNSGRIVGGRHIFRSKGGFRAGWERARIARRPPETHFAWSGDVALANQVVGDGPIDLLCLQDYSSDIDINWESPYLYDSSMAWLALGA